LAELEKVKDAFDVTVVCENCLTASVLL